MTDPFDLARAEEMLLGYSARWYDEPLEVLGVELEFDVELTNPETGAASRTFRRGGKLDVLVRRLTTGHLVVYDAKTSSEDIGAGSFFWKRLLLNTQASGYISAARELGFGEPWGACWDVLGKPAQRPLGEPIVEDGAKVVLDAAGQRVRTKDGKKWRETGDSKEGYVLQTRPETIDEYRARVREAICNEPDRYFQRGDVVRLLEEEREAMFDAWQTAANIREARRLGRHPRNPDACVRYGSTCSYFGVCTGETVLDDPLRFRLVENVHEELTGRAKCACTHAPEQHTSDGCGGVAMLGKPCECKATRRTFLPLLTNSELSAYRACARLHHYRYDLGVRAIEDADNARFGTLVHRGLEGWWLGKKDGAPEDDCVGRALEMMRAPKPALAKTMAPQTREAVSL